IGAPNSAKIPSPVDCTTRPLKRRTTSTMISSAGSTNLRASSGSSDSSRSIESLISANSTVMVLRSPSPTLRSSRDGFPAVASEDGEPSSVRLFPHSWQNFEGAGFLEPHLEQARVSAAPHSEQCLFGPGFSLPQLGQCIESATRERRSSSRDAARRLLRSRDLRLASCCAGWSAGGKSPAGFLLPALSSP